MGKEPLYGWHWGEAFLEEEVLERHSTDQLQKRLKYHRKKINDTLKYVFNFEWGEEWPSRLDGKMDMVEDLLEYCHRIEKVLEKRGIRARTVRESFEFERGKDPKEALDVGPNRRIRKGDRVEVEYKGEKFTVTAIEDEEEPKKDKVMVRSGDDWRPPEYETRTIREFWFKDDEDGICFAEAREWWDNQGNTIWPWKVPEYGKTGLGEPVLE